MQTRPGAVVTVLLNPTAGTAARLSDLPSRLAELFAAVNLEVTIVPLQSKARTADAVHEAIAAGAEAVIAAGGDGTINNVASVLVDTGTPFGVLPLGTLNHFAKALGIPTDLEDAVRTIADWNVRCVDVGEMEGRIFLNNASIGIYPDIVVEREKLRAAGSRKWTAAAIAITKVLKGYNSMVVRMATGQQWKLVQTPFVLVGNNEYRMEGLRLAERTGLDGGTLSVYYSPRLRARDVPRVLALAVLGRAKKDATLEVFSTTTLTVDTPFHRRLRVAFDGEVTVVRTPLRYRVRPRALRVIAPRPPESTQNMQEDEKN